MMRKKRRRKKKKMNKKIRKKKTRKITAKNGHLMMRIFLLNIRGLIMLETC